MSPPALPSPRPRALSRPLLSALSLTLVLSACASGPPPQAVLPQTVSAWTAPLPHGGQAGQLKDWWAQLNDPLLLDLISSAQAAHPSLEAAVARIVQARAQWQGSQASQLPRVDANATAQRGKLAVPSGSPLQSQAGLSLDASWELDLFAQNRRQTLAAQARAAASELDWHAARVSLAAEVAQTYLNLRACEVGAEIYRQDAQALAKVAELTTQKVQVGLEAPANAQLLNASAADARSRAAGQTAECQVLTKGLVALTGKDEAALRQSLQQQSGRAFAAKGFAVPAVPADALAQRPDLAAAEQQVVAALAEVGAAEAARWPQLRLNGGISLGALRVGGQSDDGRGWSIAPQLSLPLFDGGQRTAQIQAAQARSQEAYALYRSAAIQAVREVEEALVRLDAAQSREADAQRAAQGYEQVQAAAAARWNQGLGNLIELEEARRSALNARAALLQVQRDGHSAWVSLYKAVGGGWTRQDSAPQSLVSR